MPPIEIKDDDLLLINRDDTTYKVTALDLQLTGPQPVNPNPEDISISPPASGDGTEFNPYMLTSPDVEFGESVLSDQTITITDQTAGNLVIWTDLNSDRNGDRYNQSVGTVPSGGTFSTKLRFLDSPATNQVKAYSGTIRLADSNIYFRWDVNVVEPATPPVLNSVTLVSTGTNDDNRFEEQSFAASLSLTEGYPVSTKSIGYKVEGRLSYQPVTDFITDIGSVTVDGGWTGVPVGTAGWTDVAYANGKFVAVANSNTMYSEDGISWTVNNPSQNKDWLRVAYGGTRWVAISFGKQGNQAMYSDDGINWSTGSTPAGNYGSLAYGAGKFIALDYGSTEVIYSTSGASWTGVNNLPYTSDWNCVTYGGDRFVAVSASEQQAAWSTDGINWTAAITSENIRYADVTYALGKFVAVGPTNGDGIDITYSTNGQTWSSASIGLDRNWESITYADGKFVACSRGADDIAWSIDGVSWTLATAPGVCDWTSLTYGDGKFVGVASSGTPIVMYSEYGNDTYTATELTLSSEKDLINFSTGEPVTQNEPFAPITSEITGTSLVIVPGGWNSGSISANAWTGVTYGSSRYAAISAGQAAYSLDGISWNDSNGIPANQWNSVAHGNGRFVAVAETGSERVMYSSDGIDWTPAAAPTNQWKSVAFGNGKFVAVARDAAGGGGTRVMYTQNNGTSWTLGSGAPELSWQSVAFGNGKFVALGDSTTTTMVSTDGISWTWTANSALSTANWQGLTFGNGMFVATATSGSPRVMYSTDGVSWTGVSTPVVQSNPWRSVIYSDNKFVAVGDPETANNVMWSADGISWNAATSTSNSNSWTSVTSSGDKFVAVAIGGGNTRAMWSTTGADASQTETLTFADNTDLDKFEVGDLVQQNATGSALASAFSTTLWVGNGDQPVNIINGIDNTGKALIWIKNRDDAYGHYLWSTETAGFLKTNITDGLNDSGQPTFNSNGVTIAGDKDGYGWSARDENQVAWNFRAAPGFFDIQTYAGNGIAGRNVAHNLTTEPGMIIVKRTDSATNWNVYHKSLGASLGFFLNGTANATGGFAVWNGTTPTSSSFTVDADSDVNASNGTYVAYLFADDEPGLIKCGSFTLSSNSQSTVDCGFIPAFILLKSSSIADDWRIIDSGRGITTNNSSPSPTVYPNDSVSEEDVNTLYTTNTGFKTSSDTELPAGEYIYVAIAKDAMADAPVLPAGLFQSYDDQSAPLAPTMTLTSLQEGWSANTSKTAIGPSTIASGTFVNATLDSNDSKMLISDAQGPWAANEGLKVEGVEKIVDNTTLYLETNNLRQVTGTNASPVYYNTTDTTDEITFDLATGTGQTWDEEFPEGTTIQACAYADNTAAGGGRSPLTGTICSNFIQPSGPQGVSEVFATTIYAGNSASQSVLNGVDNTDKSLVWVKKFGPENHNLTDTVRGTGKVLETNFAREATDYSNGITSFDNDGFTLGNDGGWNSSAYSYVAWNFKAAPKFFDVQTWTGNGNEQQISHNLTDAPGMIIVKSYTSDSDWAVYHKSMGAESYLNLNSTAGKFNSSSVWGSTEPASTEFTVGNTGLVNGSGEEYVAYLFADEPGMINCGRYTGNGQNDRVINCGFSAGWVLIKAITDNRDWNISDIYRINEYLVPNEAQAPVNAFAASFGNASGFAVNDSPIVNGGGIEYIYVAIAAPPTNVENRFATALYTGDGNNRSVTTGINNTVLSMAWIKNRSETGNNAIVDSLRYVSGVGSTGQYTGYAGLSSDQNWSDNPVDYLTPPVTALTNNGLTINSQGGNYSRVDNDYVVWNFRAAPKFFDIVQYIGTGVGRRTVSHNLTTTPGMMIVKNLTQNDNWSTYHKSLGSSVIDLNFADAADTSSNVFDQTAPTASSFTVGAYKNYDADQYVAYLFADTPGLIKCGSYTGNNSSTGPTINCQFEPQWLMIKRTDAGQSWVIYDSARNSSNPRNTRLAANTTDAEITSSNIGINFISNGFQIVGDAGSINANLGSYIYVAIAAPVITNLTQAQVDTTKLLFETREFRKIKHEQDLVARASDLRAGFEARGFTTAEIDEVLGSE